MNNYCIKITSTPDVAGSGRWAMRLAGSYLHHPGIALERNAILLHRSFWESCPDGHEHIRRFAKIHNLPVEGKTDKCKRCGGFPLADPTVVAHCVDDPRDAV